MRLASLDQPFTSDNPGPDKKKKGGGDLSKMLFQNSADVDEVLYGVSLPHPLSMSVTPFKV